MLIHDDDRFEAAERLRMVLPMISKHGAAATPQNYALWYEYISNRNTKLTAALDELLSQTSEPDQKQLNDLYLRFVSDYDEARLREIRDSLHNVVTDIGASLSEVDGDVRRFNRSLAGFTRELDAQRPEHADLRAMMDALARETEAVRMIGEKLQNQLNENRAETERLRAELESVRQEARRDPLTGLANRIAFIDALAGWQDEHRNDEAPLCLLMVDIDLFKAVNDTHGHLVGDKVICFIAQALNQSVKGKDMVARYGGEEFSVLLPNTPYQGALALAESIRNTVERGRLVRAKTKERIGVVTVSIGVSACRSDDTIETLVERADKALYAAKNDGRNRVVGEHLLSECNDN